MGSPSRPSAKGYTTVPAEERIDDDVEHSQVEVESDDDEGLYSTSAPLLSNRSRGNEPLPTHGEPSWLHRLSHWRPFRKWHARNWDEPRKTRNWRRIFLFSLFGSMLAAIIGLSISTGVLAHEYSEERSRSHYWKPPGYYGPHTRIPLNDGWQSRNGRLNFPQVYPPLNTSPSSACQAAWNTLRGVPCHEKIWNRSWDEGKHQSLFDPDIRPYTTAICTSRCTKAISQAFTLIVSQCNEDDTFDLDGYMGPFLADPKLEEGPIGAIQTIAKRVTHICHREPTGEGRTFYPAPYCAAIMWDDWFIVDGMNAGNLYGLDTFEAKTRIKRSEWTSYFSGSTMQDWCDDVSYYPNWAPSQERQWGPGVNETTCDWCTTNWFERKLMSWEKDQVTDPKTGKVVELEDYLKRIRGAGQRCDADAWDRVWERALRKYKREGKLRDDWEAKDDTGELDMMG